MKLTDDLKSAKLIYLKGFLFLVTGLLSAAALLLDSPTLRTAFLLDLAIWSFCRLYYFSFTSSKSMLTQLQVQRALFVPAIFAAKARLRMYLKTPPAPNNGGAIKNFFRLVSPELGAKGTLSGF